MVEKNVFVPFKKTELDLLREERLKIKLKETAKKLQKKKARKLAKKRKKGRKAKKRKTVTIESSPSEAEKIPSTTASSEATNVTEAVPVEPAPVKSHGFHIPSF